MGEMLANRLTPWRESVLQSFQTLLLPRDDSDRLIHMQKFMAKKVGADEAAWFERTIYQNILKPRHFDKEVWEREKNQKNYQEGQDGADGETLDASKYGVHNIAEAVELFARKTGL